LAQRSVNLGRHGNAKNHVLALVAAQVRREAEDL
jgi:hypothetical protein